MGNKKISEMHPDFAGWHNEIGIGDETALRELRWAGVCAVVVVAKSQLIEALIRLAFKSQQTASAAQVQIIRDAFKTVDASFNMEGNDRELQVMAGASLAVLMAEGGVYGAEAALGISTASLNGARKTDLPMDLSILAESAIDQISEIRRKRPDLTKYTSNSAPKINFNTAVAKITEVQDFTGIAEGLKLAAGEVQNAFSIIARQQENTMDAIDTFVRVQDEELQMLSWLIGQRSDDLDCVFNEVTAESQGLVFAKELAGHTETLPGPASVKGVLSRAGLNQLEKITISAAIIAAKPEWFQTFMPESEVSPVTTPIHFGIMRQLEIGAGNKWVEGWAAVVDIKKTFVLSPLELGVLFYRERLFLLFCDE